MSEGVDNLMQLVKDNTGQEKRVTLLSANLKRLIQFTDSVITNPAPFSNAALLRRIAINSDYLVEIQDEVNAIKAEEKRILLARQAKNNISTDEFNKVLPAMLVGVFVLIGSTFILIRYHFNKLVVTDQKLTKANELFFRLFDDSPIAMAISQPENGVIIDCNHRFSRLINDNQQNIIGETIAELGIADSGVTEFQLHPLNSSPLWVSGTVQPIHLKDRDCVLTALVDITTRKQGEQEMMKALDKEIELNKLKSNFVTLASHEFRTPLTTILSSTGLLENYLSPENTEKVTKHILRIRGSVNNLTTILDEFLSLTKIEEGRVLPKYEKVDIGSLIESVVTNIRGTARSNQLIRSFHKGNKQVEIDSAILRQILVNIMSNAVKYSPGSGEITIASETSSDLVIRLSDYGMGIPFDEQSHLFERFFRASNAGNVPGTGLGLHLTRQYVDLLNGSISLISSPGKGTTVTVTLPLKH